MVHDDHTITALAVAFLAFLFVVIMNSVSNSEHVLLPALITGVVAFYIMRRA